MFLKEYHPCGLYTNTVIIQINKSITLFQELYDDEQCLIPQFYAEAFLELGRIQYDALMACDDEEDMSAYANQVRFNTGYTW